MHTSGCDMRLLMMLLRWLGWHVSIAACRIAEGALHTGRIGPGLGSVAPFGTERKWHKNDASPSPSGLPGAIWATAANGDLVHRIAVDFQWYAPRNATTVSIYMRGMEKTKGTI